MPCDPNELSKDAACFTCLDPRIKEAAKLKLLCDILDAVSSITPYSGVVEFSRETNADNVYGSVTALASSGEAVVIGTAFTALGYKVTGFEGQGTTDGHFWVEINGVKKYFGRINEAKKTFVLNLPNPDYIPEGSSIELIVKNEGAVAGDFEGVLYGIRSLGGFDPLLQSTLVDGDGSTLVDGDGSTLIE